MFSVAVLAPVGTVQLSRSVFLDTLRVALWHSLNPEARKKLSAKLNGYEQGKESGGSK